MREPCSVCGEAVELAEPHVELTVSIERHAPPDDSDGIELGSAEVLRSASLAYVCGAGCFEKIVAALVAAGVSIHPAPWIFESAVH